MDKLILQAEERKLFGRKIKKLRTEGIIPANVYGRKVDSFAIQIKKDEFRKVYKEAGETGLIELTVNSKKHPVLIHNVQVDPVTDIPLHVDFVQVDLKEKIEAQVPVELTGESQSEKQGIGTIVQYINEITVEALPADLPEKFEIDISNLLEVDSMVQIKDIKVGDKVTIKEENPEQIVVKVEAPQKEEVEALTPAVEGEEEPVSPANEVPVEENPKEEGVKE